MSVDTVTILLAAMLMAGLQGYSWGERRGFGRGFREGSEYARMMLEAFARPGGRPLRPQPKTSPAERGWPSDDTKDAGGSSEPGGDR